MYKEDNRSETLKHVLLLLHQLNVNVKPGHEDIERLGTVFTCNCTS